MVFLPFRRKLVVDGEVCRPKNLTEDTRRIEAHVEGAKV